MKSLRLISLTILLVPFLFANEMDPIDAAMEKAMERDGSTGGMVEAISAAHQQWEEKLNALYNQLKKAMPSDEFAALQLAQRAWITYRDKQVAAYENSYSKMDGTMWGPMCGNAIMSLIRQRAKELEGHLGLLAERNPTEDEPTQKAGNFSAADFEKVVQSFLKSDYVGNPSVAKALFTPEFAALWTKACNPPEGEVIYWGADPILETQDMDPKLINLGPATALDNQVLVPVVYQHQGQNPFTKTFVFTPAGPNWRISDILTTGLRDGMESELANLKKNL